MTDYFNPLLYQAAKKAAREAREANKPQKGLPRSLRASMDGRGPLKQRDNVLQHIKAFGRLKREDRAALLTEKVPFL